jgi:hypothetical protein
MAESEYNGKPGKWRTVKGRKVFFPDGEDEKSVINEAFGDDYKPSKKRINKGKFEKSDDGENWEELEDSQSYNDYYADEDEFDSNEDGDFEEGKLKIQVKYDGKQIEMEIPSNIEEDWQVDEAVKEKLEQIEGHEVENFEWDISNGEPSAEEFSNMSADKQKEEDIKMITDDVHSKYSRTPREEVEKIVREEWKEGRDWDEIQEAVEERMVNDPNVTGSNKEPVNDMDPYERPAEGIANSEEDDAGSPYKETDRQWMKDHIEDNPDMSDKRLMEHMLERFGELSPDDEQYVKQLLAGRHNKENNQEKPNPANDWHEKGYMLGRQNGLSDEESDELATLIYNFMKNKGK